MEFEKISNNELIVMPQNGDPCTCACNAPGDGDAKSAGKDKVHSEHTKSSGGCSQKT